MAKTTRPSWSQIARARFQALTVFLKASPFVSALIFVLFTWLALSGLEFLAENGAKDGNIKSLEDGVWWGIVTLLTVGYGDKYPVTVPGRIIAGFLMIGGVSGIAIVTAKISSYFLERALRERRGFVDTKLLSDHFVICGWKSEMAGFVTGVLSANRYLKAEQVVLLNNAPDSDLENLLSVPELKNLKIAKGEFYLQENLKRVAPERARKILILADSCPDAQGKIPTMTEADARTIMAAMTLQNFAKNTPIAAEILDPSMDQYLRIAHVNEIIYTREYSRNLVAMSSSGTGVTAIFHELLSPNRPCFITTETIPVEFIGETYGRFHEHFLKNNRHGVLIGLLENSGHAQAAKELAIRKAQQTPNIQELVENLQKVKAIKFNNPLFGVNADHIIKETSMAMLIENREALGA